MNIMKLKAILRILCTTQYAIGSLYRHNQGKSNILKNEQKKVIKGHIFYSVHYRNVSIAYTEVY